MHQSRLPEHGIIPVELQDRLSDFRESLIKTTAEEAFNVENHCVVLQVFKSRKRQFLIVSSNEDLSKVRKEYLLEKVLMIPSSKLSTFLVSCPSSGYGQFKTSKVTSCNHCGVKYL